MPHIRCRAALLVIPFVIPAVLWTGMPACADDGWNPFGQLDSAPPPPKRKTPPAAVPGEAGRPPLASMDGRLSPPGTNNTATPPEPAPGAYSAGPETPGAVTHEPLPPPVAERNRGVERGELAPVIATDGSGLPYELWRGLDVAALEGLIAKLDMPPRSPAIHSLWLRLVTAGVTPPDGGGSDNRFDLIRAQALYRSGLLEEAAKAVAPASGAAATNPVAGLMAARIEIGLGHMDKGCELSKAAIASKLAPPKHLRGEALLIAGICAASGGNPAGAGLLADIAREEKIAEPVTIAALDAIASAQKTPARGLKTVTLLHYRAFALAGGVETKDIVEHGEPALLVALAQDKTLDPAVQIAAAEAAARANALTPAALADLYRTHGAWAAARPDPALSRAALFTAAEAERTPLKKVRMIRSLLDDARRNGLYLQTLDMVARTAAAIQPVPEIGWFAETGIEIALVAATASPAALVTGDVDHARQWATLGGSVPGDNGLRHWQGLVDLGDPALKDRGRNLGPVEELASHGRLSPDLLHRLATVLDANDINVPIPLWEAASRAPQPAGGYLPETGILGALQDASKKKEFGRTVLLVMQALGPNGAEGANIIALGDAIRALRRAGLDADARRLSVEALFAQWPRSASAN